MAAQVLNPSQRRFLESGPAPDWSPAPRRPVGVSAGCFSHLLPEGEAPPSLFSSGGGPAGGLHPGCSSGAPIFQARQSHESGPSAAREQQLQQIFWAVHVCAGADERVVVHAALTALTSQRELGLWAHH